MCKKRSGRIYFIRFTFREGSKIREQRKNFTFYSSKDGQLTIQYTANIKNPDSNKEITASGKETYEYENYRFMSVSGTTTSSFGNSWTSIGSMDYKSEVKVELPSDWKSYLKLEA